MNLNQNSLGLGQAPSQRGFNNEEYIQNLESKLRVLQRSTQSTSLNSTSTVSLDSYNSEDYSNDEIGSDSGSIIIKEEREQLLENGKSSSLYGELRKGGEFPRLVSTSELALNTLELIPATAIGENDNPMNAYDDSSEQIQGGFNSRRVSFNHSVRISGGMKGNSSLKKVNNNNRKGLTEDLFNSILPTSLASTSQLIEFIDSSSLTESTTTRINSRSTSPTSRPSSHPRNSSGTSSLGPNGIEKVTTTGSSGFPSRSSSPCSSIYAPLQPSSETCPSASVLIRPRLIPKENNFEGIGILKSWKRLLFGKNQSEFENDSDSEEEQVRKENYRQIVLDQRKLKRNGGKSRRRSLPTENDSLLITTTTTQTNQSEFGWIWEISKSIKNYGSTFIGIENIQSNKNDESSSRMNKTIPRKTSNLSISTAGSFDSTKNIITTTQPIKHPSPSPNGSISSSPRNIKRNKKLQQEEKSKFFIFENCGILVGRAKIGLRKCLAGEE